MKRPGVGDEVAAVADHDRVAVEHLAELPVDAHRVQRRARVVQLSCSAARFSASTARSRSSQAVGPLRARPGRLADRRQGRADVADQVDLGRAVRSARWRDVEPDQLRLLAEGLPPKPSRKSIGTPTTSATSAPFRPARGRG